jgi:tetratricopeptide (TPR) repeat protein/GGDEF domain-containing protein
MAVDVLKAIERAKKYMERNKLREAAAEYESILAEFPTNQESVQALGDLYTRLNEGEKASQYYGLIFDRLADSRDVAKASAIYARFLKPYAQPPERLVRFALILQKQNKPSEAIECYDQAAQLYLGKNNQAEALACWDRIAQLDPENPARQLKIAQVGEQLGKPDVAARGYLRAGQLRLAEGKQEEALATLAKAHSLNGGDRSVCLVYGQALTGANQAKKAVEIMDPVSSGPVDPAFHEAFGLALMYAGQLDRATKVIEELYGGRTDSFTRFFELAHQAIEQGQDPQGVQVLERVKERMFAAKKQNEFLDEADKLVAAHPMSLALMEFSGRVFNELNRDSKYFGVLERLFELYLQKEDVKGACDSLDRLVDIDPYDFHNQDRLKKLGNRVDARYAQNISMRMAKAAAVSGPVSPGQGEAAAPAAAGPAEGARARHALEDMLVQAEIFLQYSLPAKAIEWLQKIAESFPGEEDRNDRLRNLYGQANWWPPNRPQGGGAVPLTVAAQPVAAQNLSAMPASPNQSGVFSADTIGDLSKISEITKAVYRQTTPKTVLSTAVSEIGKYLNVTRCIAVVGPPGQAPQMASEYVQPGATPSGGPQIMKLLGQLTRSVPDALGGITLRGSSVPPLGEIGLETVLGVQMVDKESQAPAGTLVVGSAAAREWKPNESYFLQAVGDQVLLCVNHTKLRSLMRTLGAADVKTGVLGPGSYQDCLLAESNRAKMDTAPFSLVILQVDGGQELVRQQGETMIEKYMEQLAVALQSGLRANDIVVKYTAWALAFILPNTPMTAARPLADKLRKTGVGVKPAWASNSLKLSAAAVEATARPDYESEDIVTDLINRVEFCLEDARKQGGDVVVAP